jgi:hypothetical protein
VDKEKSYDKVQRALRNAREAGEMPWEAVDDSLRKLQNTHHGYRDLSHFLGRVKHMYRRDKWQSQPRQIEVWAEKDTIRGTIEPVVNRYDCEWQINRGYGSLTALFKAAERIAARPTTILYIGDHDPSGCHMWQEAIDWIRDRLHPYASQSNLLTERIAVTDEDWHVLPRLPINVKDSRAKDYARRFGPEVVEVEALPPEALQERLDAAIVRHLDVDAWNNEVAIEDAEDEQLADLAKRLAS